MNRRKIRRYRRGRGNSGMKFVGFLGIMALAVICGYLTARFIIGPLLGYDTTVLKLDFPSKLTAVFGEKENADSADADAEKAAEEDEEKNLEGYALQFGLFSTEDRAEELARDLKDEGIETEICRENGRYKVISPLFETKEDALKKLENTRSRRVSDIFVTVIES